MNKQKKIFSRRQMLEMAIGLGGFALSGTTGSVLAQEANRIFTPSLVLGPFYPQMKPLDTDADLTVIAGKRGRAQGKIVHLTGRILNSKGEPVRGAKVEIWQANTHGRYSHPSDPNTAPLDPNFQGFAMLRTDKEGRYRFKTIKPGPYAIGPTVQRTPHIHFDVEGKANRLVTQMFFPDEPLNDKDPLFLGLRSQFEDSKLPVSNADVVIAKSLPPTKEIEAGATLLNWHLVLF